ncbi:MAG: lytic transglycosylase domain-containing protein, partial [Actinobacteria bacterium]|nr:lytic transglycosylase domain-containing protein [Actinomycetota bacterium]
GPPAGQAPAEVMEPALLLQRKVRFLAKRPNLSRRVIAASRPKLAAQLRTMTEAARMLRRLAGPGAGERRRKLKVGKPRSLAELVGHYRKAERLHGIGWNYLAAINLVETKFGRVKSKSTAGAQGPMQFIPSTWRMYGNGGDIQDPHDATLAAARLLRDHGAPRDYGRALYHYNPSQLYVGAVRRYAKLIARDDAAVAFLYCWGP